VKSISIAFAIVALGTGLIAAFYWYKSSKVPINQNHGPDWGLPGTGVPIEPVEPQRKTLDISIANIEGIIATNEAIKKAARLNQSAALWTAASVVSSACSAILGAMA
jgi:hypothetical protein